MPRGTPQVTRPTSPPQCPQALLGCLQPQRNRRCRLHPNGGRRRGFSSQRKPQRRSSMIRRRPVVSLVAACQQCPELFRGPRCLAWHQRRSPSSRHGSGQQGPHHQDSPRGSRQPRRRQPARLLLPVHMLARRQRRRQAWTIFC